MNVSTALEIVCALTLISLPFALAQSVSLNVTSANDPSFAFTCSPDFNATIFNWGFGDGTTIINPNPGPDNATHTYVTNGNFTVNCTATGANVSASQSVVAEVKFFSTLNATNVSINATNISGNTTNVTINTTINTTVNSTNATGNVTNETTANVTTSNGSITIKDFYPQTGAYVFSCNLPGSSFSWFYGDNSKSLNIPNQNTFHTYLQNGNYHVECQTTGFLGIRTGDATLDISVNDIPHHNTCSIFQNSPATCDGGAIVQQDFGQSCRIIICDGNGTERKVLGCDKPSADNPLYFELYKQDTENNSIQICVAGTCVGDSGYARSEVMTCDANINNGTNGNATNQTNTTSANATSVSLSFVAHGNDANLTCMPTGFTPVAYNWTFGDNATQETAIDTVSHTYPGEGNYTAMCTATDNNITRDDSALVEITPVTNETTNSTGNATNQTNVSASVTLAIAPSFPQGNDTVLICTAEGFTPKTYDWTFGDNATQETGADNVFHAYPGTGSYLAMCAATNGNISRDGNTTVTIG